MQNQSNMGSHEKKNTNPKTLLQNLQTQNKRKTKTTQDDIMKLTKKDIIDMIKDNITITIIVILFSVALLKLVNIDITTTVIITSMVYCTLMIYFKILQLEGKIIK